MTFITPKILEPTLPLPVLFIVGSQFFERFFFCGLQTIFPLYLVDILNLSPKSATLFFHIFCLFSSLCPLVAGILGDSSQGKFRAILYLAVIYVVGSAVIDAASTPIVKMDNKRTITCVGILAICLGCGCASIIPPFGGDQFPPSTWSHQLSRYFSVSYFIATVSSLAAVFITPILRHNYQCFDKDTCFPLAYSFLFIMLVISFVVFVAGRSVYVDKKPDKNILMDVIRCTSHALSNKVHTEEKKKHWLDYAEDKYSKTLISDTKAAFRVLLLLLPLPVFWALDDQTSSTWVFQAMHMDGSLGSHTIKPDQMQLLDPLMTLGLVPLFNMLMYPLLAKCNLLIQPLQRITVGGLLASVSFALAALLELQIQGTLPQLPEDGTAQLRVFNGINCDIKFNNPMVPCERVILSLGMLQALNIPQEDTATYPVSFTTANDCYLGANHTFSGMVTLKERQASSLFLHDLQNTPVVSQVPGFDRIDKTGIENPRLRILYNLVPFVNEITLTQGQFIKTFSLDNNTFTTSLDPIAYTGKFSAKLGNSSISAEIELGPAGIYTLIVHSYKNLSIARLITVTPPNSVHMLWQLPQYVIISVAEVIFAITCNELSYTQAPESMKSIIPVAFTMTDSIGNLITIIVVHSQMFESQVSELLFFSGMMVVASLIFKYISTSYEYYTPEKA